MAKWLITIGIICVVLGIAWPLLTKLGLGRLPGDIRVEKEGFGLFFPITTSIIISIVLTVIFWIFRR
jgi:ABC-type phosphate transport system permease subunit